LARSYSRSSHLPGLWRRPRSPMRAVGLAATLAARATSRRRRPAEAATTRPPASRTLSACPAGLRYLPSAEDLDLCALCTSFEVFGLSEPFLRDTYTRWP
jgi:hypothetical protein